MMRGGGLEEAKNKALEKYPRLDKIRGMNHVEFEKHCLKKIGEAGAGMKGGIPEVAKDELLNFKNWTEIHGLLPSIYDSIYDERSCIKDGDCDGYGGVCIGGKCSPPDVSNGPIDLELKDSEELKELKELAKLIKIDEAELPDIIAEYDGDIGKAIEFFRQQFGPAPGPEPEPETEPAADSLSEPAVPEPASAFDFINAAAAGDAGGAAAGRLGAQHGHHLPQTPTEEEEYLAQAMAASLAEAEAAAAAAAADSLSEFFEPAVPAPAPAAAPAVAPAPAAAGGLDLLEFAPPEPAPAPAPALEPAAAPVNIADLEARVPGGFRKTEGARDPLTQPDPEEEEEMRGNYNAFYMAGGRVIEAPEEEVVAAAVAAGQTPNWSIGIHPGDFLVPVCHQGMNRSQIMRLALTGAVGELRRRTGAVSPPRSSDTPWVSRAHGAVSGCDAHSAYQNLDEMNFFGYLFDEGDIFQPGYDAFADTDPQQGPLQRGFVQTFGEGKKPRIGEEMSRPLKLNPDSEYTAASEFQGIGTDREHTHHWFNKWVFAPLERILEESPGQPDAPVDQLTLPPPDAKRRIFFAFARAAPGIIDRLLEAHGSHNSVVVSLPYDDIMNHELRHCAGKTPAELEATMQEVHLKAYNMYASLLHADPSPGPEPRPAPETEPLVYTDEHLAAAASVGLPIDYYMESLMGR